MPQKICILQATSLDPLDILDTNIKSLKETGFDVNFVPYQVETDSWPYKKTNMTRRLDALEQAFYSDAYDIILFARGGYGASDLLLDLNFKRLSQAKPKIIVGFSDITAILNAVYAKLAWPCIHGPMPASKLWLSNQASDISLLLSLLQTKSYAFTQSLQSLNLLNAEKIQGQVFGGCLSVLCNLFGTSFFPTAEKEIVLFIEDIGETPGRLVRYFNQILLSPISKQIAAIVIGSLKMAEGSELTELETKKELALRAKVPVFSATFFGHQTPNYPLLYKAQALIVKAQDEDYKLHIEGSIR